MKSLGILPLNSTGVLIPAKYRISLIITLSEDLEPFLILSRTPFSLASPPFPSPRTQPVLMFKQIENAGHLSAVPLSHCFVLYIFYCSFMMAIKGLCLLLCFREEYLWLLQHAQG